MDELSRKLNRYFAGRVVRKDLTKKIKEGANVPVYVLEYLLGMYCATDDEDGISEGVETVKRILAENFVRPDEAEKVKSKIREIGKYTVIDKVSVKLNEKYERILGGLFGVACGDALGGTLEFMSKYEIERKYGYLKDIIGGGCWDLAPGEVTDDTMMTIAVAEGIMDNPENPIEDIGKHFIEWYDSKPKDIGNIIRIALGEYKRNSDWMKTAYYAHQATGGMSAGNGSLMRCLPVALYYNDVEKMLEITASQSVLTHYDQKATDACQFYNLIVYQFLNGNPKVPCIREYIEKYPEYKQVFQLSKDELKPTGYVVDTLICALWCFINTSSFEDAVCEAANLGGDADTIAAITGGIAGVYYGYDAIPDRWKEKILVKEQLTSIAKRIIKGNRNK